MANSTGSKGISLAKGPVGLVGLALLAYGITALIFGGHSFTQHAPSGAVHGKTWLGLEVNGWSGLLFIAAGLLLLLGAPLHWGAKAMSLVVGLALGAAALIGLAKGDGVIGIFAANHLTELVWGAAGALLIVLSLLPRVGGRTTQRQDRSERRRVTRRIDSEPAAVERDPARESAARVDRRRPSESDPGTGNGVVTPDSGATHDLPERSLSTAPEADPADTGHADEGDGRPAEAADSQTVERRLPAENGGGANGEVMTPASGSTPDVPQR